MSIVLISTDWIILYTFTMHSAFCLLSALAVIVAVPDFIPLTVPSWDISAILESDDSQIIFLFSISFVNSTNKV